MYPLQHTPNFAKFALFAAAEAIQQSNLLKNASKQNVGVIIGSGFGETASLVALPKRTRLSPYFVPGVLMNSATAQIALCFGLKGPSYALSSACATGSQTIGAALLQIQSGRAEAMVCGGSEATRNCEAAHRGFKACIALAKNNCETPLKASRPFDRQRSGFVIGEGAGVLVLEEMERAKKRGAPILARIVSHGESSDAYHITTPSPGGEGAVQAMKMAFKNRSKDKIGFISAHASSTKIGDATEVKAIERFLGRRVPNVPVYSIKGALGHSLGASGAVEAAVGIKALREGILPATLNAEELDAENTLDVVAGDARAVRTSCFLANSFGVWGA